jgi:hypothetical protein
MGADLVDARVPIQWGERKSGESGTESATVGARS